MYVHPSTTIALSTYMYTTPLSSVHVQHATLHVHVVNMLYMYIHVYTCGLT